MITFAFICEFTEPVNALCSAKMKGSWISCCEGFVQGRTFFLECAVFSVNCGVEIKNSKIKCSLQLD